MRIRIISFAILLSAISMLTSCLKDDDDTDYTYYKDTAISAFSLGTMNRYLHTTSSAGNDSVYMVQYSGTTYKFTIDQLGHRIYNADSLPYGTDLEHVIANVTAVNNGTIFLMSSDLDSLSYYSSTDSIDFSSPRNFRILSQDGQRYADYTVTVSARQAPEGTLSWEQKAQSTELAALDDVQALSAGGKVFVFGTLNGQTMGYSTNVSDGETWTRLADLPVAASIVAKDTMLYALANGEIFASADGQSWNTVATNNNLKRLVAASSAHLYALTTNGGSTPTGIAMSADNGLTWTANSVDNDPSLLPDDETRYTSIPLHTNDSIEQVMIVGRCSSVNDIYARTWTRLDDYSSYPLPAAWSYVDNSGRGSYALGQIPSLAVTVYEGNPVALVCNGDTIDTLLKSSDSGLTWEDSELTLPDSLSASVGKLAMTTDTEGSLWIIADGIVWKN